MARGVVYVGEIVEDGACTDDCPLTIERHVNIDGEFVSNVGHVVISLRTVSLPFPGSAQISQIKVSLILPSSA